MSNINWGEKYLPTLKWCPLKLEFKHQTLKQNINDLVLLKWCSFNHPLLIQQLTQHFDGLTMLK